MAASGDKENNEFVCSNVRYPFRQSSPFGCDFGSFTSLVLVENLNWVVPDFDLNSDTRILTNKG